MLLGFLPMASAWEEVPGVLPGIEAGNMQFATSFINTGSGSSLTANKWRIAYSETDWKNEWNAGGAGSFVLAAGMALEDDGWDYTPVYGKSQAAIRFTLPDASMAAATAARVSFDITQMNLLGFGIEVGDWDEGGEIPIGRGIGTRASAFNTLFNFSLVSLETGTVLSSDKGVNWSFTGSSSDTVTVSIDISFDELFTDGQGYALLIDTAYGSSSVERVETWVFDNFRVEQLITPIPEPATAVLGFAGLALMILRRRK